MAGSLGPLVKRSPYDEPDGFWRYDHGSHTFDLLPGRWPAGDVFATPEWPTGSPHPPGSGPIGGS